MIVVHYKTTPRKGELRVSKPPAVPIRIENKFVAIPFEQWPKWAKWVSERRWEGEIGVGSTIKRLLGAFGEAFKKTLAAIGVPCGCDKRAAQYDIEYPYSCLLVNSKPE